MLSLCCLILIGDMMKRLFMAIAAALMISCFGATAQEKITDGLEIDKFVHNFGDILWNSGPVSCTFTLKNTGNKPVVIYNVTTTCGCTNVDWTKEPIRPGKTGTVSVTYSNDEGPYPFDKSLTMYISEMKKPVILKLRGVSLDKIKPLEELYPVSYGKLGFKENINRCGNMDQNSQKSEAVMIANLSDSPMTVSFSDVSKNLKLSVSPNPIPARGTAELTYTITADRELWGKNYYWAVPVVNGKTYTSSEGEKKIGFWAFTREDFSNVTADEKKNGPRPAFKESTYSFGKVKMGQKVTAEYTFKNDGKAPFKVFKVDADAKITAAPVPDAAPGQSVTFKIELDTTDMSKGESLTIITLTTNSPLRPIVNLFIAGFIE